MGARLLVIDDHEPSCRLIKAIFGADDVEVFAAHDGPGGLAAAARHEPDVVLLDLRLPDVKELELLQALREAAPSRPVIMLTADRDLKMAVRATKLGAFDYLTKPIDQDEVALVVKRALEVRALEVEVEALRRQVAQGGMLAEQMGPGAAAREVIEQVKLVAPSELSVLVLGETGTGKELVAHAVHRQSQRRDKPFVALDCGAIPEQLLESELFGHEKGAFTGADRRRAGHFQLAQGGTIFLDEIGNLGVALQAKLLRVLESKEIQAVGGAKPTPLDVRFLAATNDDLQARVAAKQFRADLYFRLAQFTLRLPPLRERVDDIPHLVQRFVQEASIELRKPVQGLVPEASKLLREHTWPGNVRELRNVVRQAVLQTKALVIEADLLRALLGMGGSVKRVQPPSSSGRSLKEAVDEAARATAHHIISETLGVTGGNKSEAARMLRTDYKTLHLKMKQLGIRARDFARDDD
jgi:DNA-binding NtrC family response regulator